MAIIEGSDVNIQDLTKEGFVILDVYGDNCYFCELLDEVIKGLVFEIPMLSVVRINGSKYPAIDQAYDVFGHPTMIYMKDGKEVGRHSGFASADQLREVLAEHMY